MDSARPRPDGGPQVAAANPAALLEWILVPPQCWNRSEVKLPAGVVALAWHPWQSGRSTSTPTSSSQPPAAASASLPSSPAAPPPPPVPGTADSEPAGTEIITALAVNARGQPTNGYREAPAGSISELAGCDQPSPASVSTGFLQLLPLCGCSRCLLAITSDIDAVHE